MPVDLWDYESKLYPIIDRKQMLGETLLVKYIMMSGKVGNIGEINAVTSAELFSNGASVAKSITKSLIIK